MFLVAFLLGFACGIGMVAAAVVVSALIVKGRDDEP